MVSPLIYKGLSGLQRPKSQIQGENSFVGMRRVDKLPFNKIQVSGK